MWASGIPESGLIGVRAIFAVVFVFAQYSDMLKEFDHDTEQVKQMYKH